MNLIANNKKANFLYNIMEKLEAGIVLNGEEVKSLRNGKASINEAYAETDKGELWLINSDISSSEPAFIPLLVLSKSVGFSFDVFVPVF